MISDSFLASNVLCSLARMDPFSPSNLFPRQVGRNQQMQRGKCFAIAKDKLPLMQVHADGSWYTRTAVSVNIGHAKRSSQIPSCGDDNEKAEDTGDGTGNKYKECK